MPIEYLPVKLNEDELLVRSEELGQKVADMAQAKLDAKRVAGQMKETADGIEAEVSRLARVCREKVEDRPVEVREVMNARRRTVDFIRQDTMEIVRFRSMTENELTKPLFIPEAAEG